MDHQASETKTVILAILDGWGMSPNKEGNAIQSANTPNMDRLVSSFPHTQLEASGEAVGLPRGEVGNTETGHLNIGAGRIVYQDLARINIAIADGTFFTNPTLLEMVKHIQAHKSRVHLIGLIGAGGVHSNTEHMFALIHFCALQGVKEVYLHLITDGRDSPPTSSRLYISKIREVMRREGVGKVASVMGRYWAMDRDRRWDRTEKAYNTLAKGQGLLYKTPEEIIEDSYAKGKTDEFIEPSLIGDENGKPLAVVNEGDAVVFFNFRVDRPRQLSRAFVFETEAEITTTGWADDPYVIKYEKKHKPDLSDGTRFVRGPQIPGLFFVTMTEYEKVLTTAGAKPIFPPVVVDIPMGSVISHQNLKQLRASESEKERFVTYYFNGQRDLVYPGEERLIIPSPKVPTYDQAPEMSASELTSAVLQKLAQDYYSFILINFANADMVGHTGSFEATVKAVEAVDKCIGTLSEFVLVHGGTLVITADHGNAEEMIDQKTALPSTEHSSNPVPFIVVDSQYHLKSLPLPSGSLPDVAPTILRLMGLEPPSTMYGRDLLEQLKRRY